MDSIRISLARVLELGVRVSWREAAAIVHDAVALTGPIKGMRPTHVGPEACVLTRGGEVVLTGDAAKARPETVVRLLEDLLVVCDSPDALAAALERGTAIAYLEELSQRTTPKRRRVEIAAVALRGIAAEADLARQASGYETEAAEEDFIPEELSRRTTPKRRRVEIAAVALRGIAADADLARQASGYETEAAEEDFIPEVPAALTPRVPRPVPEPPAPIAAAAVAAIPHPTLKAVPVAAAAPIRPAHDAASHEFDRVRSEVVERNKARQSRFDFETLATWLRELDWRKLAAVGVPLVLAVAWWLWPSGVLRLPPTPRLYDPVPFAAIPLTPGWADIDRLGQAARRATASAGAVTAGAPPSAANNPGSSSITTALVAEPRSDASVALVPPAASVPTATRFPTPASTAPASTAPASVVATSTSRVADGTLASGGEGVDADTVYSWTSEGVEPPVVPVAGDARLGGARPERRQSTAPTSRCWWIRRDWWRRCGSAGGSSPARRTTGTT